MIEQGQLDNGETALTHDLHERNAVVTESRHASDTMLPPEAADVHDLDRHQRVAAARQWIAEHGYSAKRVAESDPQLQAEYDATPLPKRLIYGENFAYSYDRMLVPGYDPDKLANYVTLWRNDLASKAAKWPMIVGGELRREFNEVLPDSLPNSPIDEIVQNLSDEDFVEFMKHHVRSMNKVSLDMSERLGAVRRELEGTLMQKVKDGNLPLEPGELKRRLDRLVMNFYDVYANPPKEDEFNEHGLYFDENFGILISLNNPDVELMEHAVRHETEHGISGRMPRLATYKGKVEADNLRVGFMMFGPNRVGRFRWLNEGMTESLTSEFEGKDYVEAAKDSSVYIWEQCLLNHLEAKVPREYFKAAYYETFDPADTDTPSAWGELQRQLSEAFEPKILLTLDKIIANDEKAGMQKALEYLRSNWFEQPDPMNQPEPRKKRFRDWLRKN